MLCFEVVLVVVVKIDTGAFLIVEKFRVVIDLVAINIVVGIFWIGIVIK